MHTLVELLYLISEFSLLTSLMIIIIMSRNKLISNFEIWLNVGYKRFYNRETKGFHNWLKFFYYIMIGWDQRIKKVVDYLSCIEGKVGLIDIWCVTQNAGEFKIYPKKSGLKPVLKLHSPFLLPKRKREKNHRLS